MGNKNPNWKGGITPLNYSRLSKKTPLEKQCSICNSSRYLCVHHINFNRSNNKLSNLIIVCRSCHEKIHNKAKNFPHNVYWKKEELDYIRKNYKKMIDKELAKKIQRTVSAISHKRELMGLMKYEKTNP